jgi:GntR family transcriptional regulator
MTRIDDRPRHVQIAADLRAKILSGDFREKLPPHKRLVETYETSNNTTQRAVALLKAEGFVEGLQGKALNVCPKYAEIMDATPYWVPAVTRVRYEILRVGHERPPADAAQRLGLGDGAEAVLRKRLALRDDDPLELSWSYYPDSIATGTALDGLRRIPGGAPAALAALGWQLHGFVDEVQVREPTTEELEALDLPPRIPVLRRLRTITAQDGTALEVTVMVRGGHHYGVRYHQRLPPVD